MDVNNAEAHLVGLFVRTFLYGVYLFLLAHCLRWTFFEDEGWRLRPRINGLTLTLIALVFLSTTGTLAIWFIIVLAAIRETLLPYRSEYVLANVTLEDVTALAIDAMLIFRCWTVSNRSWPVIYFPLVLWWVNIGLFVTCIYKSAINDFAAPIVEGFYSCNLAINIYAISAIIYQITKVARKRSGAAGSSSVSDLYGICRIMLECGLPYMSSTIFQLTAMAIGTNPFLFPTNCALNSTMNAVAFHLLVMRVGLHRDDKRNNNLSSLRFNVATRDILEDYTSETSEKGTPEAV